MLSHQGCPVFVDNVEHDSPAKRAGIKEGDHILAIEGTAISDLKTATRLLTSNQPGPVTVKLARDEQIYTAVVEREKRSAIYRNAGKRIVSGVIVPPDTSQAEVDRMLAFDGHRLIDRVFAAHYPRTPELYYGGFELFILRNPDQLMVGGIEDGPAATAGVHWGDVIISVNGLPVAGKTTSKLESLFSDTQFGTMSLQVHRLGSVKTFTFPTQRADNVARQNNKRFLGEEIVPLWATEKDSHCFQ